MQLSIFKRLKLNIFCIYISEVFGSLYNHSGDGSIEDPPVLIPNTEVKLDYAQSTWLDTAWEVGELPLPLFLYSSAVEHPAVNRRVVSPNLTRGAKKSKTLLCLAFFDCSRKIYGLTK